MMDPHVLSTLLAAIYVQLWTSKVLSFTESGNCGVLHTINLLYVLLLTFIAIPNLDAIFGIALVVPWVVTFWFGYRFRSSGIHTRASLPEVSTPQVIIGGLHFSAFTPAWKVASVINSQSASPHLSVHTFWENLGASPLDIMAIENGTSMTAEDEIAVQVVLAPNPSPSTSGSDVDDFSVVADNGESDMELGRCGVPEESSQWVEDSRQLEYLSVSTNEGAWGSGEEYSFGHMWSGHGAVTNSGPQISVSSSLECLQWTEGSIGGQLVPNTGMSSEERSFPLFSAKPSDKSLHPPGDSALNPGLSCFFADMLACSSAQELDVLVHGTDGEECSFGLETGANSWIDDASAILHSHRDMFDEPVGSLAVPVPHESLEEIAPVSLSVTGDTRTHAHERVPSTPTECRVCVHEASGGSRKAKKPKRVPTEPEELERRLSNTQLALEFSVFSATSAGTDDLTRFSAFLADLPDIFGPPGPVYVSCDENDDSAIFSTVDDDSFQQVVFPRRKSNVPAMVPVELSPLVEVQLGGSVVPAVSLELPSADEDAAAPLVTPAESAALSDSSSFVMQDLDCDFGLIMDTHVDISAMNDIDFAPLLPAETNELACMDMSAGCDEDFAPLPAGVGPFASLSKPARSGARPTIPAFPSSACYSSPTSDNLLRQMLEYTPISPAASAASPQSCGSSPLTERWMNQPELTLDSSQHSTTSTDSPPQCIFASRPGNPFGAVKPCVSDILKSLSPGTPSPFRPHLNPVQNGAGKENRPQPWVPRRSPLANIAYVNDDYA